MAKLVDLLAKHLKEWPDGAEYARKDYDKEICFRGECSTDKDFFISEMAEDAVFYGAVGKTKVYMKDWLAARYRLHAETVKEMREPTNAYTDQALWDKVAIACYAHIAHKGIGIRHAAAKSFDYADAFMAERAKRLKGGV